MSAATEDPRVAEILRRKAARNGAGPPQSEAAAPGPAAAGADEGPRKLTTAERLDLNEKARDNPRFSSSDLADWFEGEHGWRPSYQAIGRCLSEPAPRKGKPKPGRKPRPAPGPPPDPEAEVLAIAAVNKALAPLSTAEVRRVLAWAYARFDAPDPESEDNP